MALLQDGQLIYQLPDLAYVSFRFFPRFFKDGQLIYQLPDPAYVSGSGFGFVV